MQSISTYLSFEHLTFPPSVDNTDIIANSVVILFICDLDELLYGILRVFPRWVKNMSHEEQIESDSDIFNCENGPEEIPHQYGGNATSEGDLESLSKEEVIILRKLLLEHKSDLARLLAAPAVSYAENGGGGGRGEVNN